MHDRVAAAVAQAVGKSVRNPSANVTPAELAHPRCNNAKSDYLAAEQHLQLWARILQVIMARARSERLDSLHPQPLSLVNQHITSGGFKNGFVRVGVMAPTTVAVSFWPHDEVDVRIATPLEWLDVEIQSVDLHEIVLTKKAADTEAPTAGANQCGPTLIAHAAAYSSHALVSILSSDDVSWAACECAETAFGGFARRRFPIGVRAGGVVDRSGFGKLRLAVESCRVVSSNRFARAGICTD